MFRVNESGGAFSFLRLGDDAERQRRLAARFRSEDLDDAAARNSSDPQSDIQRHGARRNGGNIHLYVLAQGHDGALAKMFFDLRHGRRDRLLFFRFRRFFMRGFSAVWQEQV